MENLIKKKFVKNFILNLLKKQKYKQIAANIFIISFGIQFQNSPLSRSNFVIYFDTNSSLLVYLQAAIEKSIMLLVSLLIYFMSISHVE